MIDKPGRTLVGAVTSHPVLARQDLVSYTLNTLRKSQQLDGYASLLTNDNSDNDSIVE